MLNPLLLTQNVHVNLDTDNPEQVGLVWGFFNWNVRKRNTFPKRFFERTGRLVILPFQLSIQLKFTCL